MHLFLIRHGETVDNVAKLYAGSRDSALTVHGVLQARRLGEHLGKLVIAKHVYSSDMQRAVKTAEAILDQQPAAGRPELVQLKELREKDFGNGEGVPFGQERDKTGAESAELMAKRAGEFLRGTLIPLLSAEDYTADDVCIIVAHGLINGSLFRELCSIIPSSKDITLTPEASRHGSSYGSSPVQPSWGNTGYLRATLTLASPEKVEGGKTRLKLHITDINCTDHLKGLKRTRGGIGREKFDAKQKSINAFFTPVVKKRKADEDRP